MTHSEIERAARARQTVEAKVRNSTEIMKIVGRITEITMKGEGSFLW